MLWMAAFVALWALVEAIAADLLRRYSPYQVVWMRYAVHLGFMALVWGWRTPESLWRTRRLGYQIVRSLLMLGMPASWAIGMRSGLDPETLLLIFWLSPLMILALAWALLGERAAWPVWLGGLVGFVGANLLFRHGPMPDAWQLMFPLGMALSFSLYVVMTRSLRSETTRANLFYTALGVLLALSPAMPSVWIAPDLQDVPVLLGVGVVGFGALYSLDRMAAAAAVSNAAPLTYLQLVLTLGFGWVSGHLQLHARGVAGALLIAGVGLYLWRREPGIVVANAARNAG
jgi:drug/metabolite transporter (DMT)-like permease